MKKLLVLLGMLFAAAGVDSVEAASSALLGWNNLGMHCMDASYAEFSILPPYNTIEAQLIVGGKLIQSGVGYTVTYEAVADPDGSINQSSIGKGNWMQYAPLTYGIPSSWTADIGLAGWNMPGPANVPQPMLFETLNQPVPGVFTPANWFRAEGIPITPYDDAGQKNPYPMMRLVARNSANQVIAQSDIVLPVSDEMDCRLCHGSGTQAAAMPYGGWINDPNPDREYRLNILKRHDDQEFDPVKGHPALYSEALAAKGYLPQGLHATTLAGKPMLCASCHASEALGAPSYSSPNGLGTVPPLTTSVHAKHANVIDPLLNITLNSSDNRAACYRCHPGSTTRCLRGAMGSAVAPDGTLSMQCQSCHGGMTHVGSPTRVGWLMEPSCQSCHSGTATRNNGQIRYTSVFDATGAERVAVDQTFATTPNTPAAGISLYRFSTGHGGLQCSACHGSTHAEFPASHRNDNIRNQQLQGHAGVTAECTACHSTMPTTINGGPHGMHPPSQDFVDRHHDYVSQVGVAACRTCHGADDRGTVLTRVQGPRTFKVGNLGMQSFKRGDTIGCYTCHQGASSSTMNYGAAPGIADVQAATVAGVPVPIVLPVGNPQAVLRIVEQPAHGTVGLSGNLATYFPFEGFTGTDSFTFASYDGAKNSATGQGTVTVGPNPGGAAAPVITASPITQTVLAGNDVALTVEASGGTLTYEWYRNGWLLPEATEAVLNLPGVTEAEAGTYVALVRNEFSAAVSGPATLTVLVPITLTTQPTSQTVLAGTTVTFSVAATGTAPITCQWSKNGTPISGATRSSLTLSSVTLASAGTYQVLLSNPAGTVASDPAVLTVLAPPTITRQPASVTAVEGTSVTLSLAVSANPAPAYQWYKDSLPIPGATAASLVFAPVAFTDAGNYQAWVGNDLGSVISSVAVLTVVPPPPVLSGFTPASGAVGMTVTLTGNYFTGVTEVKFNGTSAAFTIVSATQISATVPAAATTGPISVTTAGGTATTTSSFTVTVAAPKISGFSPTSGGIGTAVTITGSAFTGASAVKFNGVAATYTVVSATTIVAGVPAGATTGRLTVTTPGGTATSASNFSVGTKAALPTITSFSPTSGRVGTLITVNGNQLGAATSVRVGTVAAPFTILAANKLTLTIPAGAVTGRISVTTPGGTVTSTGTLTVTP